MRRDAAELVDVVCGMRVRAADAAAIVDHNGTRYAFCSDGCVATFRRNPTRYATAAARGSWSHSSPR